MILAQVLSGYYTSHCWIEELKPMKYEGWKVGENIHQLRENMNMSMADFCEQLGKSQSHMRMVELGHRKISLDMLYDLMEFFDTDADNILGISAKADDSSVDALLRNLPVHQREYIKGVVLYMISNMTQVA